MSAPEQNYFFLFAMRYPVFDLDMETPENAIVINGSWSKKLRLEQEEDLVKKTEVGDPIELN